jgi:hypothetical protein
MYLLCAWPSDRKGTHQVKDCRGAIKIDIGTATYPRKQQYQNSIISEESSAQGSSDSK